jgi:hypothetical protein
MKRSPGNARSHMTTNPLSETLHRPFPLKAKDSHTSSKVWPRFGKYELGLGLGLSLDSACSEPSVEGDDSAATDVELRKLRSHGRMVVTCLRPWLGMVAIFGGGARLCVGGTEDGDSEQFMVFGIGGHFRHFNGFI